MGLELRELSMKSKSKFAYLTVDIREYLRMFKKNRTHMTPVITLPN